MIYQFKADDWIEIEKMARAWREDNARNGRSDTHNIDKPPKLDLLQKIKGLSGEYGFSRITGHRWNACDLDIQKPDVGERYEIRSTDANPGHLIVHRSDADNRCFIAAIVNKTKVHFVGWMWGYEAKQERWWNKQPDKKRPCFWIPHRECRLIPIRWRDLIF